MKNHSRAGGKRESIEKLSQVHQRMQALADEMTNAHADREIHETLASLPELEGLQAQVVRHLQGLAVSSRLH